MGAFDEFIISQAGGDGEPEPVPEPCPICQDRPADLAQRTDARGRHWCAPCIAEHDSIDWDAVAERRLGM